MSDEKQDYKGYLVDLDGTMYMGPDPIEEAGPFIDRLRQANLPFLFLSNNSTASPQDVADKLGKMGVQAQTEEVYTSSLATVDYLNSRPGDSVYIIGESGLLDAVEEAGYKWDEDQPDFVLVGLDRKVTYEKFNIATLAIQKGAEFICTNRDTNIPTDRGMSPSAGALAAFLERATGQEPKYIGKPEATIMDKGIERLGLAKEDVAMIGDNYDTDILAGIDNGIDTILVFSGLTSPEELAEKDKQPTHTINSLDDWLTDV